MNDERHEVSHQEFTKIKAELGIDADTFRRTNLGKYIYDRCKIEEEQAIEELIEADPADVKKGYELRNEIYKHRAMPKFIDDAIRSGRRAEDELRQQEAANTDY